MKQDKLIYFPLFASRQLNGGFQSDEESKAVWQTIQELPEERRNILLSQNLAEAIAGLDEQFHIPEQFVEYVTVLVRDMFFGNFSEQEVLRALRSEFAKLPNLPIDDVIQYIQLHILKAEADIEKPEEDEEEKALPVATENLKQYTLLDALGKFPNLANQSITTENLKLKTQATPVRPTLSNWLKNYRDELGIGKHDSAARAKFLFESSNTSKLPDWERDRIHALVRSLEDNETLSIDPQKQEIVFIKERKEETNTPSQTNLPPDSSSQAPDIFERFQSQQPREELRSVGTQTFVGEKPPLEKKGNDPANSLKSSQVGKQEAVLSRIKNMFVAPAKANAPAPQEDFIQRAESESGLRTGEPLGTLRFSAKHVLPAERRTPDSQQGSQVAGGANESRLSQFSPQDVAIPGGSRAVSPPTLATGPQYSVHVANSNAPLSPQSLQPPMSVQQEQAVPNPKYEPASIFRIKPSRE